ncbi:MAG: LysR substrate-binding domain-containing protein [Pirellulales bacterium]
MTIQVPSLSTDEVSTLVELARSGSLRLAAQALHVTEQGVRSRLVTLEQRLGVELYRKSRGRRTEDPLTPAGRRLLPQAKKFLEEARQLHEAVGGETDREEIHVAASQYLILYLLIDAVRRFRRAEPGVRVRLSNHTEREIEELLLTDIDVDFGLAAPYDSPAELEYVNLFPLEWHLITPVGHPLAGRAPLPLSKLAGIPLILLERGSTGRQHVMEALQGAGVDPWVEMETTNTEIIVRMVEAGLGVSIVPLMPSGVVTRGRRVSIRRLAQPVRPIQSGILRRRHEPLSPAAARFLRFLAPNREIPDKFSPTP